MDIHSYLAAAIKRQNVANERAISLLMEVPQGMLTNWRKGRVPEWPYMQKLARLAGVSETEASVDWAEWKGVPSPIAAKLKRALKAAGPMLLLIAVITSTDATVSEAHAVTSPASNCIL